MRIAIHILLCDSSNVTRVVDCYFPGNDFPAVSVTGSLCALRCKHCSGVFLKSMLRAADPEALVERARQLSDAGATGFLLTGGSDSRGRVPISAFADAIKVIKETTTLRINAHVGLMPRPELARLVDNVVVVVEDDPPAGDPELLGLYEGIPITERDSGYAGALPDRITIYRRPTLRICETADDVVEEVHITVVHEIAHYFGIDDDRLHELGYA